MNFIDFYPMRRGRNASAAASGGSDSSTTKRSKSTIFGLLQRQAAIDATNAPEGVTTRGAGTLHSNNRGEEDDDASGKRPVPKDKEEEEFVEAAFSSSSRGDATRATCRGVGG